MAKIGKNLRSMGERVVGFMCPGCDRIHLVTIDQTQKPSWGYNNNPDAPTFTPSILLKTGHHMNSHQGECWCDYNKARPDEEPDFECTLCHSFVRDGQIQFLNDCTHHLAGQTMGLPEIRS